MIKRVLKPLHAALAWAAAQWRADTLLVVVELLAAVGGAAVLVNPSVPWGVGQ